VTHQLRRHPHRPRLGPKPTLLPCYSCCDYSRRSP